jgi:hypothetical protein
MPDGPVSRRADRAWRLRGCLAAWFAALLAIAPVAQPSLLIDPAAGQPAAVQGHGSAATMEPAAALQPTQPAGLGILSRPSPVETALGPVPAQPPVHRPGAADRVVIASDAAKAPKAAARAVFQRSSVGTARTPTGPPV